MVVVFSLGLFILVRYVQKERENKEDKKEKWIEGLNKNK